MPEIPLLESASLPEFFREKVTHSLQVLKVQASPHAEFYLVQLLTTFTHSHNLFEQNEKGEMVDKALALRFFDSLMVTSHEKVPVLKKMGDIALYTSGFFADSLFKKIVGADYYIHMGEVAYSSASQLLRSEAGGALKELFEELAKNFMNFSDVLSDVAESAHIRSDLNLLKLYERWLKTGSNRVHDLLLKEGITPNNLVKTEQTH